MLVLISATSLDNQNNLKIISKNSWIIHNKIYQGSLEIKLLSHIREITFNKMGEKIEELFYNPGHMPLGAVGT